MEDDPQTVENCVGQLGLASQFWLGGGGGSSFFTAATGWTCDFSRRGRSPADHHVGQAEEGVKLMPVFGQSPIPHFPMPENILQDMEGGFHERPHRGLGFSSRRRNFK